MADTSNVTIGLLGRFRDKIKAKLDTVHSSATLANKTAQLGVQSLGYVSNNILRNTQPVDTRISGGITFVKGTDGIISASGTATTDVSYILDPNFTPIAGVEYRLWGCYTNGSDSTYSLVAEGSSGDVVSCHDSNDGITFNATSEVYNIYISVKNGTTLSNATFSPMLSIVGTESESYTPYVPSVQTQVNDVTEIAESMVDRVSKNLIKIVPTNHYGVEISIDDEGQMVLNGTNTSSSNQIYKMGLVYLEAGVHYTLVDDAITEEGAYYVHLRDSESLDTQGGQFMNTLGYACKDFTVETSRYYLVAVRIVGSATFDNMVLRPMLCRRSDYEASTKFVPYVTPTSEFQAQIKPIAEASVTLVDRVAKNLIKPVPTEHYGVSITVDEDGQVVLNGTNTSATNQVYRMGVVYLEVGVRYTLVDETITDGSTYYVHIRDSEALDNLGNLLVSTASANAKDFTVDASRNYLVAIAIAGSAAYTDLTLRPMLCLRSDYEISTKFVPYADSNLELQFRTEDLEASVATNTTNIATNTTNISTIDATLTDFMKDVFGVPTPAIASGDDLDTYTTVGAFACPSQAVASTLSNCPVKSAFRFEVKTTGAANRLIHIIYPNTSTGEIYMRNYTSSGWSAWHVYKDAGAVDVNSAYDAIAGPSFTGRTNLLEILEKSYTKNGITITCNNDGSITLDGTSTSSGAFISVYDLRAGYTTSTSHQNYRLLGSGNYILSGCTASCRIQVFGTDTLDAVGSQIVASPADGSAATFTITDSHKYVYTRLYIAAGASFSNETIYPMIRKADVADDTWVEAKGSLQFQIDSLRQLIVDNILNGTW